MRDLIYLMIGLLIFSQCQNEVNSRATEQTRVLPKLNSSTLSEMQDIALIDSLFDRTEIKARLQKKIDQNEPLIVHLYIPLCDNENQGIVPTTKSLGDGMNLRTNLYWATSGGTKGYFKKQADWQIVYDAFDIDTNVLERIVFKKAYPESVVYLVADAYRGDRMQETVNNYLAAISNNRHETIQLNDSTTINIASHSDLIMFNGHNGVMDNITIQPWVNKTAKRTDIVMNACVSYGYLQDAFMKAGGYPLVRTNTLLYPGAYALEQIVEDWVAGTEEVQLCLNAGKAYCIRHNCGRGTKVYKTGW